MTYCINDTLSDIDYINDIYSLYCINDTCCIIIYNMLF